MMVMTSLKCFFTLVSYTKLYMSSYLYYIVILYLPVLLYSWYYNT